MKKIACVGLIVGLVLAAVVVGVVLTSLYPLPPPPKPEGIENQTDHEWFSTAGTIISIVNITLAIALLVIYINTYRETKSEFTIGLIIVMVVLFLYAFTSNPLIQWGFKYHAYGLGPFVVLPNLFATIALVVLLYLSLK